MPRSVRFTILRDGTVETEFTGFPGDECLTEAEALQSVLRKYGLRVGNQKVTMKSPDQIMHESGVEDEATAQRGRAKVGHEN